MTVFFYILTFLDKNNIRQLSVKITFIGIHCETGEKVLQKQVRKFYRNVILHRTSGFPQLKFKQKIPDV